MITRAHDTPAEHQSGLGIGTFNHQRGSASVIIVAIAATILTVTMLTATIASVLVARHRVATTADTAALAAADTVLGIIPGEPCQNARETASKNGVRLAECGINGSIVTVRTDTLLFGITVTAKARAGPPHRKL